MKTLTKINKSLVIPFDEGVKQLNKQLQLSAASPRRALCDTEEHGQMKGRQTVIKEGFIEELNQEIWFSFRQEKKEDKHFRPR